MDGDILRNLRVFAVPDETQHSLEGGGASRMDRFRPPELREEPLVNCDNCGSEQYYDNLYWDEYSEKYFCDKTCFYEWADANIEIVCDYYWSMNIE